MVTYFLIILTNSIGNGLIPGVNVRIPDDLHTNEFD